MGDLPGHPFRGNQWTASQFFGTRVDSAVPRFTSRAEAKAWLQEQKASRLRIPFPPSEHAPIEGKVDELGDQEVLVSDLRWNAQPEVNTKGVVEKLDYAEAHGKNPAIYVEKRGPKDFAIYDGHHRAVAAYMAGDKWIKVRVVAKPGEFANLWTKNPPKRVR